MTADRDAHLDAWERAAVQDLRRVASSLGVSTAAGEASGGETLIDLPSPPRTPGRRGLLVAAAVLVVLTAAVAVVVRREAGSVRPATSDSAVAKVDRICRTLTIDDGGSRFYARDDAVPLAWRGQDVAGTIRTVNGGDAATFESGGVEVRVAAVRADGPCPPWPDAVPDAKRLAGRPTGIDAVRAALNGGQFDYLARPGGGGWMLADVVGGTGGIAASTGGVLVDHDGKTIGDVVFPTPMVVVAGAATADALHVIGLRCDGVVEVNSSAYLDGCDPGDIVLLRIRSDGTVASIPLPEGVPAAAGPGDPVPSFRMFHSDDHVLLVYDDPNGAKAWLLANDGSWMTVEPEPANAENLYQVGDRVVAIVLIADTPPRARVFDPDTRRWAPEVVGPDLPMGDGGSFTTATASRWLAISSGRDVTTADAFDPVSGRWQRFDLPGVGDPETAMVETGAESGDLVAMALSRQWIVVDTATGRSTPFAWALRMPIDLGDGRVASVDQDATLEVIDLPRP